MGRKSQFRFIFEKVFWKEKKYLEFHLKKVHESILAVYCFFFIIQSSRQTAISLTDFLKKTTTFASRQILSLTIFPLHFVRRWNFYSMPSSVSFSLHSVSFCSQLDFSLAYVSYATAQENTLEGIAMLFKFKLYGCGRAKWELQAYCSSWLDQPKCLESVKQPRKKKEDEKRK